MGIHTDFVGYVLVEPALNAAEIDYLQAFSESRRWDRPEGPYAVPDNPLVAETARGDRYNRPGPGVPQLWCPITPSTSGRRLCWNGHEKPYQTGRWLQYVIDHFLRADAFASLDTSGLFDGFTFDHRFKGVLAGSCREDGRVFLIEVDGVEVTERTLLTPGMVPEPLAYEQEIDRWAPRPRAVRRLSSV